MKALLKMNEDKAKYFPDNQQLGGVFVKASGSLETTDR